METTKVVFKMLDDEVLAIFPDTIYNEGLNTRTILDCYMHIGQHSSCSIDLLHELPNASKTQYKDLKAELEQIGYIFEIKNRTIKFIYNNTTHIFKFQIIDPDFWIGEDNFDIHYCAEYNEICVYIVGEYSQSIYSEKINK
jgi:hypothetical protein